MTVNPTHQARRFAQLLSERTQTRVTLDYHDSVHHRGRARHLHWTDGPTWWLGVEGQDVVDIC